MSSLLRPLRRHEQENSVSAQFLVILGLAVVDLAAVAFVAQGGGIWDQSTFRMCCLIGASGGAILALRLMPSRQGNETKTVKGIADKVICSAIGGWVFTPIVMRTAKIPVDVDMVLAASCGVAFLSVATLEAFAATYRAIIQKVIDRKAASYGLTDDHTPPSSPK
jgi:NO-binding membrane sensor protein with MHYT domain